ncbi:MAG: carbon-nitrogen hydrolase family protein [Gammaproteobacteria bacterium]|jgi:predicted amidohydrolase
MAGSKITRRQFNKWLAGGLCLAGLPFTAQIAGAKIAQQPRKRIHAAAIQMVPKLGDLRWNLNQAERLIQRATRQGAQWIILPEMFTSAAAFHDNMLKAIQPLDGEPFQLLNRLSREGNVVIGGSFLASRKQQVFNTFVLVFPDGTFVQHDKDLPTYWENCYYRGGQDDGVLKTPLGPVGSALCWEFIRSKTARRLLNRVNLVVGGSCWWTLPDDADPDSPRWAANLKMLQEAPPRMARMLGVPVIHGSHAGKFEGFFSPALPDVAYNSAFLGEAMIVDGQGKVLARKAQHEGEGVIMAMVEVPATPQPSEAIPERYWIPAQMPDDWKQSWQRWFAKGRDYYERVTLPYLASGSINEYIPAYMR